MKSHIGGLVVVLAALACGIAFSQDPPAPAPAPTPAEKLEQELAAAKLRIEALTGEVSDLKKQMEVVLHYLEEQSRAAGSMAEVLDESEKAGFTYGINPDSRHILLRGWRDLLATAQRDVPQAPPPAPAPAPAKRLPRQTTKQ